jgi:hypothetical protein
MCHFIVSPLFGNSHTGLLLDVKSTDLAAWYAAKHSVAYTEPIILAGVFFFCFFCLFVCLFVCSSIRQLGQFASEGELRSENVTNVHAEEIGTVDKRAEDHTSFIKLQ